MLTFSYIILKLPDHIRKKLSMEENFEVVPDVVNIFIWLLENDKFKDRN